MSNSKREPRMWAVLPLRDSNGSVQPLFEHMAREDKPVANFGWSYVEGCDLHRLCNMEGDEWQRDWVDKGLADVWNKAAWLNNIQPGDYLLYINVPNYNKVTIVQAKESGQYKEYIKNSEYQKYKKKGNTQTFAPCYQYSSEPENSIEGDGFHQICIENEIWTFDRNDKKIVGEYSVWLKNRSNHWAIDDKLIELILKAKDENKLTKVENIIPPPPAPTPKLPFAPFKRFKYLIENLIGHGTLGQISVLGGLALFGILFAAACLFLLNSSLPFLDYMWSSLQLVLDTGNLAGVKDSNSTAAAIALSMVLTLFGLFVFGGIVGILEKFLETYLKRLQQGLTEIMEEDHIVLLGWTDDAISLIEEFIQSNNTVNEIVILSEQATEEIYNQIKELKRLYRNSKTKFIVREGNIHDEARLKKLNLLYSKNIILGADNDETNFKTLLTLINIFGSSALKNRADKAKHNNGNEGDDDSKNKSQVKVMVSIYTAEYLAAFNAVKSNIPKDLDVDFYLFLINKRDILQKIVAQSILDIYTVPIYKDLFSYQGAELYLMEGKEFLAKYTNKKIGEYTKGENSSEKDEKISLEISEEIIPLGIYLNGKNIFDREYSQKNIENGKVIYLGVGTNIEGEAAQTQDIEFNYSKIERVYLIGNPDMCSKIEEEVVRNNTGKNTKKLEVKRSEVLPEKADIKNSLIFYISGGEEGEDIKMVKMYLQDAQRYNFNNIEDQNNQIITTLLIDSEVMFRISEKVLEKTPCVISNQIVKRMLAQASVSTELLSIYETLLGSSPNTKEIITTPANDSDKDKTFISLYEELKALNEPYFLMGYVNTKGHTVLCPKVYEKFDGIERLILLGERDNMEFDGNEFILKR